MLVHRNSPRRAVAAVELAFILPFLVIILLGVWEIGRLIQVQQILNNAVREGVRLAAQSHTIKDDNSIQDIMVSSGTPNVETTIKNYLREAGLSSTGVTVTFTYLNGDTSKTQPYQGTKGQRFRVTMNIPFNNVRWTLLGLSNITTLNAAVEWTVMVDDPFQLNSTLPTW